MGGWKVRILKMGRGEEWWGRGRAGEGGGRRGGEGRRRRVWAGGTEREKG